MNAPIVLDLARATEIASRHGLVIDDDTQDETYEAPTMYEIAVGVDFAPTNVIRTDVTFCDNPAGWTVDPMIDDRSLTPERAREIAAMIIRAADLADELNQPEPDMIVELLESKPNLTNTNLVLFDLARPGEPEDTFFSLQPDARIGKHQPGDVWGRVGCKLDFIGKFDFICWGERDGRKVAMLKHRGL